MSNVVYIGFYESIDNIKNDKDQHTGNQLAAHIFREYSKYECQ
jgi:hypothetical protein